MSPARATLPHSPGRKPWVNCFHTFIEPHRGGTNSAHLVCVVAVRIFCVVMYLSVGAFACVGKCRSFGAQSAFICVYPGLHFGLCPHSTLGYAGVSCLRHSELAWMLIITQRVPHNTMVSNFDALALYQCKGERIWNSDCVSYSQNLGEVCINFSWSLQKVLRTYKFKYAYLLKRVHALTKVFVRTYDFEEPSTLGAKTPGGRKVVSLC